MKVKSFPSRFDNAWITEPKPTGTSETIETPERNHQNHRNNGTKPSKRNHRNTRNSYKNLNKTIETDSIPG